MVVRDLAVALKRQGHTAMVYSPQLGAIADEIRSLGIEVTDNLATLSSAPDVLHGHHHAPVIEALLRFPSLPGIYVCHDATSPLDQPVYLPRLLRYIAVDNRCRKRLEAVPEIPRQRIGLVLNAIDLDRFQPRGPLPFAPKRALVFSNNAHPTTHLPAVRRACRRFGLTLDVIGVRAGNAVPDPEHFLGRYDLVFAKARCALEALACGCAVVLCDSAGVGPMVISDNFDELRRMNFGQGVLLNPLRAKFIEAEIEHYNSEDATRVGLRTRAESGMDKAVQQWLAIYRDVMEEGLGMSANPELEYPVLSRYVREWNYQSGVMAERRRMMDKIRNLPLIGPLFPGLWRRLRHWI